MTVVRRRIRGFLFDMDGVLYRGHRPLPGARTVLTRLERLGLPYALVTNNSTRTPRQYVRHLAAMRMRVQEDRIVTSSVVAAEYLKKILRPGDRVLIIGERGLQQAVRAAGLVPSEDRVAAVVVGLDRHLTYRRLAAAVGALLGGAAFVATNPDRLLPTEAGEIPGAGALVAALVYATGRRPIMIGKPRPALLRQAMARIGTRPAETVMVGDQAATDVAAGRAVGAYTVLVQSGLGPPRRARGSLPRPDLVVRDLRELWRTISPTLR
ncbi:MAG: HAD-IIA family hydrolase [Armatimonadota bacterium]|nr:HAD-IIA family hydrolase [Armatimonadota bacterium]